jgi:hypothetical protein
MQALFAVMALHSELTRAQIATTPAGLAATREPTERFQLSWQAPPDCPGRDDVRHEIDELIAESSSAPRPAPILAQASVVREGDGFALALSLRDIDASSSRHIGAPTCEELGHAAALVIAMAIDPTVFERPAEFRASASSGAAADGAHCVYHCRLSDLPPAAASRLASATKIVEPLRSRTSETAVDRLRWQVGIGAVGNLGTLPKFGWGSSLLGAIQGRRIRFDVSLSALSSRTRSITVPARGAEFDLYRITPRLCWLAASNAWSAGPCASFELGVISAEGFGVTMPHRDKSLWLASSFGALVGLRLATSSIVLLNADIGAPWKPYTFEVAKEPLSESHVSGNLAIHLVAGWQ